MDTGKQPALKQSSDGSFELVVADEVEATPDPKPDPAPSAATTEATPGVALKWIVLAVVVVALGGLAAVLAMSSGDEAEESEEPAGFRPYTGGSESGNGTPASAAIKPVDPVKPSTPARRVVDEDEVEEMERVEGMGPGQEWEVDEAGGEIVESEEIPPEFLDEVAQMEGDVEDIEEIEPERDGTKLADPKMLRNIRQQINRDIEIRKNLPNIKLNARPTQLRPIFKNGVNDDPESLEDVTVIGEGGNEELGTEDEEVEVIE